MIRFSTLFLFITLVVVSNNLRAEEGDDNLIIHLQNGYFHTVGDKLDLPGAYNNVMGIGGELMYQYFIKNKLAFAGGITYQSGKISTATIVNNLTYNDRFRFGELSMSLLLKKYTKMPTKRTFYYSGGICPGILVGDKWEQTQNGAIWDTVNKRYQPNYSEDSFFMDLYADAGILQPIGPLAGLTIAPYLRYRLKDNWFGNYRSNASFGIKIGIHLQFKK